MTFRSEADVRQWLKRLGPTWWIENKHGGTVGFPDAVHARGGRALFVELKLASFRSEGGWTFQAAPSQLIQLKALRKAGLEAWLIAGLEGTSLLGALKGGDGARRIGSSKAVGGRVTYHVERWFADWSDDGRWPSAL